jgi:hypothetical protein
MRSVVLSLTLAVSLSASAVAAPSCEEVLAVVRPHLGSVQPFLGGTWEPTDRPAQIERLLVDNGGKAVFMGEGRDGRVYRWEREGYDPIVIKFYTSSYDAEWDDRLLHLLREYSRPTDYVQVVPEVRPRTKHLRFYKYIRGLTYGSLPPRLLESVSEAYYAYLGELTARLRLTYGEREVTSQGYLPERIIVRAFGQGARILNLHYHNLIFETETGRLWVIDPR